MECRFLGYSDGRNWKRWLRYDCDLQSKSWSEGRLAYPCPTQHDGGSIVNRGYGKRHWLGSWLDQPIFGGSKILATFAVKACAGFLEGARLDSDAGKWVKENSVEKMWANRWYNVEQDQTQVAVFARLTDANMVFFKLRFS